MSEIDDILTGFMALANGAAVETGVNNAAHELATHLSNSGAWHPEIAKNIYSDGPNIVVDHPMASHFEFGSASHPPQPLVRMAVIGNQDVVASNVHDSIMDSLNQVQF